MADGDCSTISIVITAIVSVVHIGIWAFVLLAFLNERAARFNVTVLIPLIYVAHMLPFHTLTEVKRQACKGWESVDDYIVDLLVVPRLFKDAQSYARTNCFESPISPQGMLLFGALSSTWRLHVL